MIEQAFLDILQCPTCGHHPLVLSDDRPTALSCASCQSRYPIVEGIPDLAPTDEQTPDPYRTETLSNLIAGVYDAALPLMSSALWRCSPLRFVDWAHMVAGHARGGMHLAMPINTGRIYQHIWGEYLEGTRVVAVDQSWNMLRQARRNLKRAGVESQLLVRASPHSLPFRPKAFQSVFSFNGLHTFTQRERVWHEMRRVSAPDGLLAGSTLLRESHRVAHYVLDHYERRGVSPMPRSLDFVISELQSIAGDSRWFHESYGSVLFFGVET